MTLTTYFTRILGGFINKMGQLLTFLADFTPQTLTDIDIRIYLL